MDVMSVKVTQSKLVDKYEANVAKLKAAADATAEAVRKAMEVARGSVEQVAQLKAKISTTTEPESLSDLKSQLSSAQKAQDDAFNKLDLAKAAEKTHIMSALKTNGADVDKTVAEKESLEGKLAAARAAHANAMEEAERYLTLSRAAPDDKNAKDKAAQADAKVEKLSAEMRSLQDEVNNANKVEKSAETKAAEAKAEADAAKARTEANLLKAEVKSQ